jgi:biofilm PGA synthesis lipoprotein PgaB
MTLLSARLGIRAVVFASLLLLSLQISVSARAEPRPVEPGSFLALCYHEVLDDARALPDAYAVEASELASQFAWLREHGYKPVSLAEILAARRGERALPEKAVLLTFDDGYRSFYTRVYPLLKLYGYPALLAVVGTWMEAGATDFVDYGGRMVPRSTFLSWEEVREMVRSGLVEVASHSYDLHRGIPANPQGNMEPAAITRLYDAATGTYEDDVRYTARLRADLERASSLIARELGRRPRAIVWPFGAYNKTTIEAARTLGMPVTLTLGEGWTDPQQPLDAVNRTLVRLNPVLGDFVGEVSTQTSAPRRVVHVDLDYVYSEDVAEQERNLSTLLDRIKMLGPSTVYLQAFADPDGDGVADAVYFPNRHLPLRADLFNRVAWQLQTRANVEVFAWMPLLAFRLPEGHPAAGLTVAASVASAGPGTYARLSPFHPVARRVILDLYEDLARHAAFHGILFHDDAVLSDFEDASPWALEVYARDWGLPSSVDKIRRDPELASAWAKHKTAALIELTREALELSKAFRMPLKSARNLYAAPVLNSAAEAWFAQSLPAFLAAYDHTALLAMPYLEGATDPERWLDSLLERVKQHPGALDKVVFELQATDWRSPRPVDSNVIARAMRRLQLGGALNFGYYPDDFVRNHPTLELVKPALSLAADLE